MARARQSGGMGLERPVDRLDVATLRAAAARPSLHGRVRRIDVFAELPSTNAHVLAADAPAPGLLDVCLAEHQTAGRGRRGRRWVSLPACGLCLSAGWTFAAPPPQLQSLPLAVGVAARRAIAAVCGVDVALKWPNDLVHDDRKLGGILVEAGVAPGGGCRAVAGIGINVSLPPAHLATLCDWPNGATDLARATQGTPPSRTRLALALVAELARLFERFAASGFASYRDDWRGADYLAGRRVEIDDPQRTAGIAAGIDADGALLVAMPDGERRRVISGEVSVRPQP